MFNHFFFLRTYNTYNSLERKRANTLTIDLGLRRHSDNRLRRALSPTDL